ncbi:MAG: ComF family protein [Salibacteraceae bacterium]
MKLLWGKAEIDHASSLFYFNKGNRIQKLMHQLKYKGQEKLGEELGEIMGKELLNEETYKNIDGIIPVPLHASKLRVRGYNQCDPIAKGLARILKTAIYYDVVIRSRANVSQTLKNHFERHENVDELFEVKKPELLNNRKILLIDDVITTGSTLASCAKSINQCSNSKLLVSTLAIADY